MQGITYQKGLIVDTFQVSKNPWIKEPMKNFFFLSVYHVFSLNVKLLTVLDVEENKEQWLKKKEVL